MKFHKRTFFRVLNTVKSTKYPAWPSDATRPGHMWDGNADAWNDFPHFFAGFFSCEGGVAYHAHNYIQGQSRTRGAVYHEKVQFCSMNTFGREWNRLREITKLCIRQAYINISVPYQKQIRGDYVINSPIWHKCLMPGYKRFHITRFSSEMCPNNEGRTRTVGQKSC